MKTTSKPLVRLINCCLLSNRICNDVPFAGVGLAKRALVMNEFSHIDCQIHGDEWTVEIKGIRDSTLKFKLGEETPERVTEDGRKVTVIFTNKSFIY